MQKLKNVAAVLLTLALLFGTLAGCGSEPQDDNDAQPKRDEISVCLAQDINDSLDPHLMTSAVSRSVLFNVFEGLVKPTPEGHLIPAVASGFTISESGDTFTFTLREGIKFHNGDPVTADDIVYSISRVAGFDTGTPLISAFSIVGTVTAESSDTVVIRTSEPNIEFLAFLTAAILPRGYDEQATEPIGTGPYKYVSRSPQENIILERFDDYWGGPANIGRVTFRILDNTEALMMALRGGTIDVCPNLMVNQMAELQGRGYNFEIGTMNLVQAVYLNNEVPPFDNIEVRRALSHAINREEIMEVLADGLGVPLGSSMYPAFTKYFTPGLVDLYEFDVDKARALLAQAGYPDGFDMEIVAPSNHQPHVDTATVVVGQMQAVGVNATIRLVEWSTWLSDIYTAREFQTTIVGVDASAMTARTMYERFTTGNSRNFTNFSDEEFDAVFAAAIAATNDVEQTHLYKQLELILADRAANLYIQDLCDIVAINEDISGFVFYPQYVLDLARLRFN